MNTALTAARWTQADRPAPTPAARPCTALRLPNTGARQALAYWCSLPPLMAGRQRLRPQQAGRYGTTVQFDEPLLRRWHALLGPGGSAACGLPLLYGQGAGTLLYLRLFADLGLQLRHLLHLQHRVQHPLGAAALAAARQQRLQVGLHRVLRLAEDRALVDLQTEVLDSNGQALALVQDSFLVRGLPAADLQGLPGSRQAMRELLGLRRRQPRLLHVDTPRQVVPLALRADLGRRFGQVSGDRNPVHTSAWGAWLFGFSRPFLQGLGLRSLVVKELAAMDAPLAQFDICFANPAELGQTLQLCVQGRQWEVVAGLGRPQQQLVAFGSFG
jgi:hypothetical protein